jgi:polyhydroxybutyrate depolymerase
MASGLAALALISLALVLPGRVAAAEVVRPAARSAPEEIATPLSGGCGQPAPAAAPSSIEVGGRQRGLITVVPDGYRADQPHALVIAFHGRTNSNAKARTYFGLEEAARVPTIFVYPSGLRRPDGTYSWSAPGEPVASLRDFALFDAVVARISSLYCIDRTQVFAVGHSLGAWFANNLGCARGDVLRAIGTIAGAITRSDCRGGAAAVLFHNPHDRQVRYRYGLAARDWLRDWNGVGSRAHEISLDGFDCQRYGAASASNPVLWCPYTWDRGRSGSYYPHHWPDGAGRAIMDFFASLPGATTASAVRSMAGGPPG